MQLTLNYLMDATSFLMESETLLLWLARSCQVGGSLGETARLLAALTMTQLESMIAQPASTMGRCAW